MQAIRQVIGHIAALLQHIETNRVLLDAISVEYCRPP